MQGQSHALPSPELAQREALVPHNSHTRARELQEPTISTAQDLSILDPKPPGPMKKAPGVEAPGVEVFSPLVPRPSRNSEPTVYSKHCNKDRTNRIQETAKYSVLFLELFLVP